MKKLMTLMFAFTLAISASAAWTPWAQIPNGAILGEPSVVVTKNGSIHVMGRGTDNALWWTRSNDGGKTWFGNNTSQTWTKVGGVLTSSPSCLEPIPNVVECYVRNIEKGVSQIDRINEAWGPWANVGGVIMGNIAATAVNEDVRKLYVVNNKGFMATNMWDGRNSSTPGWQGWTNWDDEVGKTSWLACSDLGGNSASYFGGDVVIQETDRVCVINWPGGTFSLLKDFSKGNDEVLHNFAKAASDFPAHVKLHSVSTAMDLYFVGKDQQMKSGTFKFGKGWTGPFETMANGKFASGPSCDGTVSKAKANTICVGRGLDGAVWYSFRPSADGDGNVDPGEVATGKVLFNAGTANDINAMYARPNASDGKTLIVKTSDAAKCYVTFCDVNLGVLLLRKTTVGDSAVAVLMTGSKTLTNGDSVVHANGISKFPNGVKMISAVVNVSLKIGQTTPVIVRVVKPKAPFNDPNAYDAFLVNVTLTK